MSAHFITHGAVIALFAVAVAVRRRRHCPSTSRPVDLPAGRCPLATAALRWAPPRPFGRSRLTTTSSPTPNQSGAKRREQRDGPDLGTAACGANLVSEQRHRMATQLYIRTNSSRPAAIGAARQETCPNMRLQPCNPSHRQKPLPMGTLPFPRTLLHLVCASSWLLPICRYAAAACQTLSKTPNHIAAASSGQAQSRTARVFVVQTCKHPPMILPSADNCIDQLQRSREETSLFCISLVTRTTPLCLRPTHPNVH